MFLTVFNSVRHIGNFENPSRIWEKSDTEGGLDPSPTPQAEKSHAELLLTPIIIKHHADI